MSRCLIALGSNLGDRSAILQQAIETIAERLGPVVASEPFTTRPVGGPASQAEFLNAAASSDTQRSPRETLRILQDIETQFGRTRSERWQARTLDLDLLLYDDHVLDEPSLQLPHPRMSFRRFVLEPAAAIAGDMPHPTTQFTVRELLQRLEARPVHVVIVGSGATEAVNRTAEQLSAATFFLDDLSGQLASVTAADSRARLMESAWQQAVATSSIVVSDFWIGDFLRGPEPKDGIPQDRAILQLPRGLLAPHLMIRVKEPRAGREAYAVDDSNSVTAASDRFPIMALHGASLDDVVREATAAIQAMM